MEDEEEKRMERMVTRVSAAGKVIRILMALEAQVQLLEQNAPLMEQMAQEPKRKERVLEQTLRFHCSFVRKLAMTAL